MRWSAGFSAPVEVSVNLYEYDREDLFYDQSGREPPFGWIGHRIYGSGHLQLTEFQYLPEQVQFFRLQPLINPGSRLSRSGDLLLMNELLRQTVPALLKGFRPYYSQITVIESGYYLMEF